MKKRKKRICLPLLMMALVCFTGNICAQAASLALPDLKQNGSVSVTMKDTETGRIVSGGSLSLIHVADAVEEDADYRFQYTVEFAGCRFRLDDVQSENLAENLAEYADEKGIDGILQEIAPDGTVSFENLQTGLYLIVQRTAADGGYAASPFLVSVPMRAADGNGWIYEVDASPKVELIKSETPGGEPENPTTPGSSTPISIVERLPQTGQLNWPVPVMTIIGLLLFAVGWKMRQDTAGVADVMTETAGPVNIASEPAELKDDAVQITETEEERQV